MTSFLIDPAASLRKVQRSRKLMLLALSGFAFVAFLLVRSCWYSSAYFLYYIQMIGVAMIVSCIIGRTWCALYIGGRKRQMIVTAGPYSLVRNPLYVFTFIGVFGSAAQTGSLLVASMITLGVFAVFAHVVRYEEEFLLGRFPEEFQDYARKVPRFVPRLSGWRDVEELAITPRLIWRTFFQSFLFLVAIPLAEIAVSLQDSDVIPVLLTVW